MLAKILFLYERKEFQQIYDYRRSIIQRKLVIGRKIYIESIDNVMNKGNFEIKDCITSLIYKELA